MPEVSSANLGPYAFGVGTTTLGMLLGSLFSGKDSLVEFQKHMDMESYIQEMKEMFLKRDQFANLLKIVLIVATIAILCEVMLCLVFGYRLRSLKMYLNASLELANEKFDKVETVIESILRDQQVIDIEQLKFFKNEIEQQRESFSDLITSTSLELKTKITDSKSVCLKAKSSVRTDLKNVQDLLENIQTVKNDILSLNKVLEETSQSTKVLDTQVKVFTADVNQKMDNAVSALENTLKDLNVKQENNTVDLMKCNCLLLNSQTLFEASIAKFEQVALVKDFDSGEKTPFSERLVMCLTRATELNNFLNSEEKEDLNLDVQSTTSQDRTKNNSQKDHCTNSMLFALSKRISLLEEKSCDHQFLISDITKRIQNVDNKTSEKLSHMQFYSEEWITSWVSVIYSLFNSSFQHLENQLFSIDCMEYTRLFDIAGAKIEENSNLFCNIMDSCKDCCLKTIKEVNLLIFEYYLIQKSSTNTSPHLISMCNAKIDDELNVLFSYLQNEISNSTDDKSKRSQFDELLPKLKEDLTADLKNDTAKFNELVRHNLHDFYIIHDTMKSICKASTTHPNGGYHLYENQEENDDSIVEISDNSLLSAYEDSSFSEADLTAQHSFEEYSLKPFKLTNHRQQKQRTTL